MSFLAWLTNSNNFLAVVLQLFGRGKWASVRASKSLNASRVSSCLNTKDNNYTTLELLEIGAPAKSMSSDCPSQCSELFSVWLYVLTVTKNIWSSLIIVHHKSFIHESICLKLIFTRSVFSHALLHIQTDLFHRYHVRRCSIHQEKYFPFLELVHNQVCWCNHLVTVRYIQDVVKLIKLIPSCRSGYRQKDGKPDQPWNQLPIPTTAHTFDSPSEFANNGRWQRQMGVTTKDR